MDFNEIPQYTVNADYAVNVGWDYLPTWYLTHVQEYGLDVNPPFQRGHVWTEQQKTRYIEYILKGGHSGRDIYCNEPEWKYGGRTQYVLVDGKQRLDAVLGFLNNEVRAFDRLYREFTGKLRIVGPDFKWHVNTLKTYQEVMQWYLDLNTGGTVHSEEELTRVRDLIVVGQDYWAPDHITRFTQSGLDREIFRVVKQERLEQEQKLMEAAAKRATELSKMPRRGKKR